MIGFLWGLCALFTAIGLGLVAYGIREGRPADRALFPRGARRRWRWGDTAAFAGLGLAPLVIGVGSGLLAHHLGAPTFELMRSEWRCTASHVESGTTVQSGVNGTTLILPSDEEVCDRYERVGAQY